ncbi:MAG: hypothetical protein NDF52_05335 [archaeon YNP-WB-062]|nr:hypothetical protein [Candidatus Culexarchaeum yellowstonense]
MERYPLEIEWECPLCGRNREFRFIKAGYNVATYGCEWCATKVNIPKSKLEKFLKKPSREVIDRLIEAVDDIKFLWECVEGTIESEFNDVTLYFEATDIGISIKNFLDKLKRWHI